MSPNFIQEQLSLSYVRSVIFHTGFNLAVWTVDEHGVDGTIRRPSRGVNRLDFQLKSTTRYTVSGSDIRYDLRVEDYNRLVLDDDLPRVLILFIMPYDADQWLAQSEDELCLRKCSYWVSLMGLPPSPNSSTVRVSVPLTNVFDQNGLHDMFRQLIG